MPECPHCGTPCDEHVRTINFWQVRNLIDELVWNPRIDDTYDQKHKRIDEMTKEILIIAAEARGKKDYRR